TLRRAQFLQRMSTRNHKRISPVVAMIDDAAARRPPAEIKRTIGRELRADEVDLLRIAKRERRCTPLVRAKSRHVGPRITLQQQEIDRHVFRGAGGSRGQNFQVHFNAEDAESAEILYNSSVIS